jgi:hypothetical protein
MRSLGLLTIVISCVGLMAGCSGSSQPQTDATPVVQDLNITPDAEHPQTEGDAGEQSNSPSSHSASGSK